MKPIGIGIEVVKHDSDTDSETDFDSERLSGLNDFLVVVVVIVF